MPVRLPTVRALCTEPELALVVASRKPELKLHKPAQLDRLRPSLVRAPTARSPRPSTFLRRNPPQEG